MSSSGPSHVCLHPPLRWGHRQQSQDSVCFCPEITDTKRGSDAELWNVDERRGLLQQVGMLSFNQKMIAFVWLLFDFLFLCFRSDMACLLMCSVLRCDSGSTGEPEINVAFSNFIYFSHVHCTKYLWFFILEKVLQ